jgi:O-antigen/teichoic acid export membrane protein
MSAQLDERQRLRSRILRGLAWKAGSQTMLLVSRFVVALVLARLLAPTDFGLAAMVLVFSGFVVLFADSALGTALIQRRELADGDRSTLFWTGVAVGLALTVAGIALSGPLASFYGEPDVQPLFAALSLSFIVSSLGTTQGALLARELNFRALELRQMAATVAGAVVGISVAVAGLGAWAIVTQQLAIATVSTILLWRYSPWRPSWTFSTASLKSFGGFSGTVFAQNLVYYLGRNLDNVLIGRFLGPASLGVYALSYNVMLAPFHRIAGPVQQVLFPAFSQMQDEPGRLGAAWVRVSRMIGALSMPALVGLAVVAPDFVHVVLGERWSAATPVIQMLAWVGLVQSLQALNGEVLLARGRAGTLFRYTLLWFASSAAAFVIGLNWGLLGVAACYAVACTFVEPVNAILTARSVEMSIWKFLRALVGVAQATAVMGLAVLATRMVLVDQGVPPALRLVLVIVVGICVYVPCCAWRSPETAAEVRSVLSRRARRHVSDTPAGARLSET